jgi:2-dehydropantoate 2-reductase
VKFVIVGAGAIGAYLGARMARAGQDVTLFARGPHLLAMQQRGVRVLSPEGDFEARPKVSGTLEEIGPADVVILGIKAHGLAALAPRLGPLLTSDTTVVSTQNGLPWWFFQCEGGRYAELTPERLDPGRAISGAIDFRRVLGSIVYFSTEIAEPGVIRYISGDRISLGEPDGARSERCRAIAGVLNAAGLHCPVTTHLRQEIWVKLIGSVAFNPMSLLTGATIGEMLRDPEMRELVRAIMTEAEQIANALDVELPVSIDRRIAGAEKVGEHKTSMLQDFEAGRPMELDAIVGAVADLGDRMGLKIPHIRTVYACAKLMVECRGREGVART